MQALGPYSESLVAYLYDVRSVKSGEYKDKQIVVMHPAHIGRKPQNLDKYKVGEIYTLRVREKADSQWATAKFSDDTDQLDLIPYVQVEDDVRYPGEEVVRRWLQKACGVSAGEAEIDPQTTQITRRFSDRGEQKKEKGSSSALILFFPPLASVSSVSSVLKQHSTPRQTSPY